MKRGVISGEQVVQGLFHCRVKRRRGGERMEGRQKWLVVVGGGGGPD